MNFLGGAISLDSFLKAYKIKKTKGFFPYQWFDCPENMNNKELPPYDSFFSILRNSNPLEREQRLSKPCQQWFNNRAGSSQFMNG